MFGSSPLGFGATQDFASQAQSQSPEKRVRVEDKQTCIPATCRLLLDAVEQGNVEKELLLHGQEVVNVVLVGVVEELSKGAVVEFTLNDGSGRLKVRHYQNNGHEEVNHSIVPGSYVSVVGTPRPSPALHISAMSLRAVTNADEISYHTIEVAHVALTLKRGGSRAPAPSPATQSTASQPVVAAPAKAQAVATTSTPNAEVVSTGGVAKDLRSSILEVLRRESEVRAEGVPLAWLCEQLKGSASSEVKAILEELVNDGEAFNTIDDLHFQAL